MLLWFAAQVTLANLPSGKVFAGHDSGFYTLVPNEYVRLGTQAWDVKSDFGAPNFEGLVTQPVGLLIAALGLFHVSMPATGRFFYAFQILLLELGTFWSVWLILGRAFPTANKIVRAFSAFFAALAASFNTFTAVLLLYPPSNFQIGVMVWPLVIAAEQYFLWIRPRVSTAMLFAVLLAFATCGNPAHTILGIGLVLIVYAVNALVTRQFFLKPVLAGACTFIGITSYVWLPGFAGAFLYPGGGLSNVPGADPRALADAVAVVARRTTVSALLRFDGLTWWPLTRNAPIFGSPSMLVSSFAPALVAVAGILSRSRYVVASWLLLLVGLEFAKSVQGPLPLPWAWIVTHVPLAGAYREPYSKFVLFILIALPWAFALGAVHLWAMGKAGRVGVCVAFLAVSYTTWPFLAGRVAEPYFLTNIPSDYKAVDNLTAANLDNRILSLPGAPGRLNVVTWFKGGNFENFLFRAKTLNAATFKERSISAAPLYDDFGMQQVRELPEIIGMLGLYHVNYVLLHKDYLTGYQMAFDREPYKVLGPQIALASEEYLDSDARLQKIFEGSNLVLYRVAPSQTLPYLYGSYEAAVQTGFENNLLGTAAAGILTADRHPIVLFAGNQYPLTRRNPISRLIPKAQLVVAAPFIDEQGALYPNQIELARSQAQILSQRVLNERKPTAYVFVQPHGDYINGSVPSLDNISGTFTVDRATTLTPEAIIEAPTVGKEILAQFIGSDGNPAWPLISFSDEAVPDYELLDDQKFSVAEVLQTPVLPRASSRTIEKFVQSSLIVEHSSAVYAFRLSTGADVDQFVVARGPKLRLSLFDDPRIGLQYGVPNPSVTAVWIRFDLLAPNGERIAFYKQLDDRGSLEDYPLRAMLQSALDHRFDELVNLHINDRQWMTSRSFFSPDQAKDFVLTGISLVMGKQPGLDASGNPAFYSTRLRSLTIRLANSTPLAYPLRGYYSTFASGQTSVAISKAQSISVARKNGSVIVNASVSTHGLPLTEPLVGNLVQFVLNNGGVVTANVLRELPADYVISTEPGKEQRLSKASIQSIASIKPWPGRYGLVMRLPAIDLARFPEMRVRYLQGSSDEQVLLRVGMQTPHGVVEVTPSYDVDLSSLEQPVPDELISAATPMGLNRSVPLDGSVVQGGETGWHEIVCDMRKVENQLGTLHATPRYVRLTFLFRPSDATLDTGGPTGPPVVNYTFAFGDVAFFGQQFDSALKSQPDRAFAIDSNPLIVKSAQAVGGSRDSLKLSFDAVQLQRGVHRFNSYLNQPWMLQSAALVPPQSKRRTHPQVTVHRIDDLLYSVHITANRAAWLAFAETYNNGWRLIRVTAPANRRSWVWSFRWLAAGVGDHVVGNAYNNTWYLDAPASGDYVLDFAPQDFEIIGRALAVLTLLLVAATLLLRRLVRR